MIYWYFNIKPCSITGLKSPPGDILQRFYRIYHTIVAGENLYHFVNGDTVSCLKWHKEISYHFGSHGEISYHFGSHGEIYFLDEIFYCFFTCPVVPDISYRFEWYYQITYHFGRRTSGGWFPGHPRPPHHTACCCWGHVSPPGNPPQ